MLKISEELAGRIRSHGTQAYPYECCGALLGHDAEKGRDVLDLVPLANRRDDSPRNRFSITAQDVRLAEKAAGTQGMELLGWYHSHPDAPARPSEYDREHAWPWYSYIILSVEARVPRDMKSWRLRDDRSSYEPEELETASRAPA
jgi:proteasome lid subunit RPN8/RPN11